MNTPVAIFVRHGDYAQQPNTPSAHQPYGLTAKGHQQAQDASTLIRNMLDAHGWSLNTTVYCSGLLRAWQTAEHIRASLCPTGHLVSDHALNERAVGSAANLSLSDIENILADDPRYTPPPKSWKSDSHYCLPLPGAESLMAAGQRVCTYLCQIMATPDANQPETATVFVGHGAAMRHAAHLAGAMAFEDIARLSMFHATPVALSAPTDGPWHHLAGAWKIRDSKDTPLD